MRSFITRFQPAAGFVSGVLIGLSIITPVFAAASSTAEDWGTVVTLLAAVLLIVGVLLKAALDAPRPARVRIEPGTPMSGGDVKRNR